MNNGPVRQLNNFAKVIKVDEQGKPIQEEVKEEVKRVVPTKQETIVKEKNPMIPFYTVIILILIAILIAFLAYYVLPRMI